MKRTGMFLILACIFVVFTVTALQCFAAETKILKIGALDALTGFMAPGEAPMNAGEQLCVEWINDNGGITIDGQRYLIKLVTEDTKSTGEGMIAAATKLAGHGI